MTLEDAWTTLDSFITAIASGGKSQVANVTFLNRKLILPWTGLLYASKKSISFPCMTGGLVCLNIAYTYRLQGCSVGKPVT